MSIRFRVSGDDHDDDYVAYDYDDYDDDEASHHG